MPTAPVNNQGVVVYYEDTGAPEGCEDYLTLVLLHGLSFHGGESIDGIANTQTSPDLI